MSASSPYDPPLTDTQPPFVYPDSAGVTNGDPIRMLSWLYYALAAFEAVLALVSIVMLLQASAALSRATRSPEVGRGLPRMPNLGGAFDSLLIYLVLTAVIAVIVHVLCGYYLNRRIKYVFCVAVAVVTCLSFPLGTLLGGASLLLLMRPEVKASFSQR